MNKIIICLLIAGFIIFIFVSITYILSGIFSHIYKKRRNSFIRFLKELGIYKEYITNLKTMAKHHNRNNHFFYCHKPERYVIDAFSWMGTKQGTAFWRTVNNIWVEIIRKERMGYITQLDKNSLKIADISKTYGEPYKKQNNNMPKRNR